MFRTNDVKGGINEFEMSGSKDEEKDFFFEYIEAFRYCFTKRVSVSGDHVEKLNSSSFPSLLVRMVSMQI
jgi:hypothetical protein